MGASGAYGGSGGAAWKKARDQAGDFGTDPSSENAQQLVSDVADALNWDAGDDPQSLISPGRLRPIVARPIIRTPGGGHGDGIGGLVGGAAGAAQGTGGRQRSRAEAAAVGGSVAAAGLALRAGDEGTLEQFGLTLADLEPLDPFEQARQILDAVSGSVGGIQEDELQHASGVAILAVLADGATADDAVRAFIADYVFEVAITEVGDEIRDGTRDGYTTVEEEDQVRDLIETAVNQLALPDRLEPENIQEVIYRALDDARTFLRVGE